jgi:hypothetical protein
MLIILSLHLGPMTCADVSFSCLKTLIPVYLLFSIACRAYLQQLRCCALFLISYAAAMNTLANHGYISRKYGELLCSNCVLLILSHSGITSFEEIILGTAEAFNLDRDMSSNMAAINMVRMSMFRPVFLHLSTKAHAGKSFREQNQHRWSLGSGPSAAGSNRWTRDTGNSKTRTGGRLAITHLGL